jgi:hypothetical protein
VLARLRPASRPRSGPFSSRIRRQRPDRTEIRRTAPRLVARQRFLGQGAGNKLWAQGFSAGVTLGAAHEAFAVRPGSFHGCRLHRKTRTSATKIPLVHQ